eukprot:Gb_36356 [translate_table: standard]
MLRSTRVQEERPLSDGVPLLPVTLFRFSPAVGRIGGLAVCKGLEGLQLKRSIWKIALRAQGMQFWFVLLQTGAVLMSCLVCLVLGSWFAVWGFIHPWCRGRVQISLFLLDKSLPHSGLAVHAVLTVRGWFVRCLESLSMHFYSRFRWVAACRSGMLFFCYWLYSEVASLLPYGRPLVGSSSSWWCVSSSFGDGLRGSCLLMVVPLGICQLA